MSVAAVLLIVRYEITLIKFVVEERDEEYGGLAILFQIFKRNIIIEIIK
jgi:hypothetical protein